METFDTRYWLSHANELRAIAGQTNDAKARAVLLRIAAAYEGLARWHGADGMKRHPFGRL